MHQALAVGADPISRALARARGVLPDQGPIGVFVHHNTLHAFQHQPFHEGVQAGAAALGARPYLTLQVFRAALRAGRVADADLRNEIDRFLGSGAQHFETPEALAEALAQQLSADTTVLVKGSRFMRMERVVNLLLADDNDKGGKHAA